MDQLMNRRDLLKLAGMGVAVFVSGTAIRAGGSQQKENDRIQWPLSVKSNFNGCRPI
jgi:hypothetical protein